MESESEDSQEEDLENEDPVGSSPFIRQSQQKSSAFLVC